MVHSKPSPADGGGFSWRRNNISITRHIKPVKEIRRVYDGTKSTKNPEEYWGRSQDPARRDSGQAARELVKNLNANVMKEAEEAKEKETAEKKK